MTTKLAKPLKREIEIGGKPYTLLIIPEGLKLTAKGKRTGHEIAWQDILSGQVALAAALAGSIAEKKRR